MIRFMKQSAKVYKLARKYRRLKKDHSNKSIDSVFDIYMAERAIMYDMLSEIMFGD